MLCQHRAALDFDFTVVYLINYNVLGPLSLSADIKGSSKGTNNYEFQANIIIIIKFNSSQSRLCFISSSPRQTIPFVKLPDKHCVIDVAACSLPT